MLILNYENRSFFLRKGDCVLRDYDVRNFSVRGRGRDCLMGAKCNLLLCLLFLFEENKG